MNAAGARAPERVLIVHNRYQQRGGEDAVVEAEAGLLRAHGHAVELYERHNDEVPPGGGRIGLAVEALWSRRSAREVAVRIETFRPDLVHVHNTLPLISPAVHWAAAAAGVPVVQTLHNFRLLCPQAMLLREGRVCESCLGRMPLPAVRHRCYRGSAAASATVAAMLQLHRGLGTWERKVALFVALSEFARAKFIEGGLPAGRIRVKPNFVDLPAPPAVERSGFLFVGRLAPEKGLGVLARAMSEAGGAAVPAMEMRVAGSGPDEPLLVGIPQVRRLGVLDAPAVVREMSLARALVLPSLSYEGFPRTLVEAAACALPVIGSRLGSLAELIEDGRTGLLFEPGDGAELAARLRWAAEHPAEMRRMGEQARARYEREWTGAANHRSLRAIYAQAIRPVPSAH